jgi:hypothetical protein
MPVLTVSEKTWPQAGFSRKREILPSSSRMTIPKSSGFSTLLRTIVASEPFSSWKLTRRVRSASVRASPLMIRSRSPSRPSCCSAILTEPRRPGWGVLDGVAHAHAPVGAVAEVVPDLVWHELQRHGDIIEAVTHQQAHDVLHARHVHDGDHRLRAGRW